MNRTDLLKIGKALMMLALLGLAVMLAEAAIRAAKSAVLNT